MKIEYFMLSLRNIRKKGVRSWLTMLGIFVGIAAVVSLISLGQGMQEFMDDQFASMGNDMIIVMPGTGFEGFGSNKLTEHDEKLIKSVRGVKNVAPFIIKISRVEFGKDRIDTWIAGVPFDDRYELLEDIDTFKQIAGTRPDDKDKYKVNVGYLFYTGDKFDGKEVKPGSKLIINGVQFRVSGALDRIGNDQDDSQIYINLDTAKELFSEDGYDQFMLRSEEGQDPSVVAERITEEMRQDRNQEEGEENFNVQTSEQLMEMMGGIMSSVQAVVVGISMISLMVGGIGIMNAMYTSVLERTPEIGVMKAIGAKNRDIMEMFLVESGVMGMVGGFVGIIIGLGMSKSVEYYAVNYLNQDLLKASTDPVIIFGALAFSFITGCLSGVFPAMQAAKLKPVEALRYE